VSLKNALYQAMNEHLPKITKVNPAHIAILKVHKHEFFLNTFFAETESLWSQEPVTRDF
jgi:hypothetical protein